MQTELSPKRQINHKVMRVIVGVIALALSPAVWVLSGGGDEITSISISYWTDARDVFVGSLIAVGFFLSAYNGTGDRKDWEFWLSKAACVFAVCVALFPTQGFNETHIAADWVQTAAGAIGLMPKTVHYGAAVLLFACLIALVLFFSVRAMKKGKPHRANTYRVIAALMMIGILCGGIIAVKGNLDGMIFWVEAWSLTLFGIGWLVAGSYRSDDLKAAETVEDYEKQHQIT